MGTQCLFGGKKNSYHLSSKYVQRGVSLMKRAGERKAGMNGVEKKKELPNEQCEENGGSIS